MRLPDSLTTLPLRLCNIRKCFSGKNGAKIARKLPLAWQKYIIRKLFPHSNSIDLIATLPSHERKNMAMRYFTAPDFPQTAAGLSLQQKLFVIDAIFPCENSLIIIDELPMPERVARIEKLPMNERLHATEKLPMTERVAAIERLPMKERMYATEKLPMTERIAAIERLPMKERMYATEKLPMTERIAAIERLPVKERLHATEKLPMTERIAAIERLPMAERVASIEKLPMAERVASIEKLPIPERMEAIESLPFHERRLAIETLPLPERIEAIIKLPMKERKPAIVKLPPTEQVLAARELLPYELFRNTFNTNAYGKKLDNMPDEQYLELFFYARMKRELNLKEPKSYSEKLQWLKLHNRNPLYPRLVDKYEAKKHVAAIIGEEYIIPTLGVWNSFDDIDFDTLPNQFVLKTTHDSAGIYICHDKNKLDKDAARNILTTHLAKNHFYIAREWVYKDIPPRIIAEKYMADDSSPELKDYKFFCFDGVPRMCYVASDRFNEHEELKFTFLDMDYNIIPCSQKHPIDENETTPPAGFEEMKKLAEKLSEGIPHVRVDLYSINNKIYFGELTFYSNAGLEPFTPDEWDFKFGEWLKLPTIKP